MGFHPLCKCILHPSIWIIMWCFIISKSIARGSFYFWEQLCLWFLKRKTVKNTLTQLCHLELWWSSPELGKNYFFEWQAPQSYSGFVHHLQNGMHVCVEIMQLEKTVVYVAFSKSQVSCITLISYLQARKCCRIVCCPDSQEYAGQVQKKAH